MVVGCSAATCGLGASCTTAGAASSFSASCTGLRMSTISPVPSTVAPVMPDPLQLRTDRLHHDFLVAAQHLVHVQRDRVAAAPQEQRRREALLLADRIGG